MLDPLGLVDAVVVAAPAPVAARLLRYVAPGAADAAAGIELSSSAVVALSLPPDTALPDNSGILVATGEPLRAKAFTLSSRKWPHLAERKTALVRASFGKFGDDAPLRWSDAELIAAATEDLATVTGVPITPIEAVVQRWPGGLAQYAPGHTDRVAEIDRAVAELDGLAVAGANQRRGGGGAGGPGARAGPPPPRRPRDTPSASASRANRATDNPVRPFSTALRVAGLTSMRRASSRNDSPAARRAARIASCGGSVGRSSMCSEYPNTPRPRSTAFETGLRAHLTRNRYRWDCSLGAIVRSPDSGPPYREEELRCRST